MTKKYYESARHQDVQDASHVIRQAKNHRQNRGYHASLMQTARLHIDAIRYFNKKLEAYN